MARYHKEIVWVPPMQARVADKEIWIRRVQDGIELRAELRAVVRHTEARVGINGVWEPLHGPSVPSQLEPWVPAHAVADHTPQERPAELVEIGETSSDCALDDRVVSGRQDQPRRVIDLFGRPALGPVDQTGEPPPR